MGKGISQVATAAIYVGVTVTAISVALTAGTPVIENMQDAASVRQAQQFMQELDNDVESVIAEGEGSTRQLTHSFDRGEIYFDNSTDSLVYELETSANVISPQTASVSGDVILSSSSNVTVSNATIDSTDCYMMENEHIKACIKDLGGPGNYTNISTSELLTMYQFKDESRNLSANLTVELNSEPNSSEGVGYTTAEFGDYIGTGEVKAVVESDYGFTYDVFFRLPTGADFLKVDVRNFR
ncbi:MAG: hypothetical protein ABEJ56_05150 [Candidatus Nanohaloarchaea archaeon]